MKNILLVIAINSLSGLLLGQYSYFNNAFLPPYPNEGSGESGSLLARNDTLFIAGFAPFENENGRSILAINNAGDLIANYQYPAGLDVHNIDFSDTVIPMGNGYVWAGGNGSYPIILFMDHEFNEEQKIEFPGFLTDTTYSTFFTSCVTSDNGIIAIGRRTYDLLPDQPGQDYSNLIIVKTSNSGEVIMNLEYSAVDLGISGILNGPFILPRGGVIELANGDFSVFSSVGNPLDCYAFKFDSEGNYIDHVKWGNYTYGDGSSWPVQISGNEFQFAYGAYSHMEGDQYFYSPRMGTLDISDMTVEIQPALAHSFTFGQLTDLERTPDGGFAILGYGDLNTNGDEFGYVYIIKTDSEGNEEWYHQYTPPESYDTQTAYDLEITSDGGFAFVGNYYPNELGVAYYKTWIVKTDACGELVNLGCAVDVEENALMSFIVYPNPTSEVLNITSDLAYGRILIRDITGKVVYSKANQSRMFQESIDVASLAKGLYLLELDFGQGIVVTKKIVFE